MASINGGSDFRDLDEDTIRLIIQIQLDDAEVYTSRSKGKGREGEVSDEMIAFELQKKDLESLATLHADRNMAISISRANQTDGEVLAETQAQEMIAEQDRGLALELANGTAPSKREVTREDPENETLYSRLLQKFRLMFIPQKDFLSISPGSEVGDQAESSQWAASKPIEASARTCDTCYDVVMLADVARLPCEHEYCGNCLTHFFEESMVDESIFPPRCCRIPISVESVRMFLNSDVIERFTEKKVEFETANRTYCHSPGCSSFINPTYIVDDVAKCSTCGSTTCAICKAAAHGGDCPKDPHLQQFLETAQENGWQRCLSCRSFIELDHGCNHITCRCGNEFCYLCAAAWKTCACPQWDERRLLARAVEIADREPGLPRRPLREIAQDLRHNHDCQRHVFRIVRGSHECEECHQTLNDYILECRRCQLRSCVRCERNRH